MASHTPFNPPIPDKIDHVVHWANLHGSAQGLAIANAARKHSGLTVLIAPDSQSARRFSKALKFFLNDSLPIHVFPDWETLPYDHFSPHEDILSERIATLYQLPRLKNGIVILSINTVLQKVAPQEHLDANTFFLNTGDQFSIAETRGRLEACGYRFVNQVVEHGEFASRGSIFDLFPMGSKTPFRIDLFDDAIDTIRYFDPETQRSLEKIETINLLPAHEFPVDESGISLFRQQWRETFSGNPLECKIYSDVSEQIIPAGIEYYVPLFFKFTQSLIEYFPSNALVIQLPGIHSASEKFWEEVKERHEQLRHDIQRPILSPDILFTATNEIFSLINRFLSIKCDDITDKLSKNSVPFETRTPPSLLINHRAPEPLAEIKTFLAPSDHKTLVCAESPGRRESLLELFGKHKISASTVTTWQEFCDKTDNTLFITVGPLEQGLINETPAISIITESQLFGEQIVKQRERKSKLINSDALIRDLAELQEGSPVVHIEHGVGRYLGLQTLAHGEQMTEFLTLQYAEGDKLYVPVSSLHLINRYTGGDEETAPLHKLGSDRWLKAKKKAAKQAKDVAVELLDLHAKREARSGFQFQLPEKEYQIFCDGFPFEETPDQSQAIQEVLADMTQEKSMDRLICGDVGFGKTEVAMRAAFIAVQNNKQVVILVPTTLLARQHYQTFCDRFSEQAVRIGLASRFQSKADITALIQNISERKIDILIGTHKVLHTDFKFKDLGLMIIDEEHRFGVSQKEKLKSLRAEVDILTLTATPIPRTLNMAIHEFRDISLIASPPARRLAIKTFTHEYSSSLIREAILREILRGGQVFYVHNKVQSIERVAHEIADIVPEAKVAIGHGQMREKELEQVMTDYYHNRFNVLVCTTIIESGIDIPNANTIIIDRADKFGLAQLHQLRGRVGRSHHQAYAYLLLPDQNVMTSDAKKRIKAITSMEQLGIGFTLATHDLEIRGAGELLGDQQSGHMQTIGFSLYMELLERAVKAIRSGETFDEEAPMPTKTEVNLPVTALIPEDYMHDVHARLIFYKRISNAKDLDALNELKIELVDRFGVLPEHALNLFAITELKLLSETLGIHKIEANRRGGRIEFNPEPNINTVALIKLIQEKPHTYKMQGAEKLKFTFPDAENTDYIKEITELLAQLLS